MSDLVPCVVEGGIIPDHLIERAKEYARASKADSTLRTYKAAWSVFTAWCSSRALPSIPSTPDVVVGYIADQAERLKPQTIRKHLAAISQLHKLAGHPSPAQHEAVRLTMRGLCRVKGSSSKPKRALRVDHLKKMLLEVPNTQVGVRDKAILLVGFCGGMRRSEIVALDVADVAFEPEGLVITIRKSKRDQEAKGRQLAVPRGRHEATCPVRAVRRWMDTQGLTEGALFVRLDPGGDGKRLNDRAVALLVKQAAARAGLDPEMFAGHSLRRGFATEAARAGASEREIAKTTGHASMVVLRGYIEAGTMFEGCAGRMLDL